MWKQCEEEVAVSVGVDVEAARLRKNHGLTSLSLGFQPRQFLINGLQHSSLACFKLPFGTLNYL